MIEGHANFESKAPMQNPSQQPSGRKEDDMIEGESWIDDQRNRALQVPFIDDTNSLRP